MPLPVQLVMPGLVPGIHFFRFVDGRVKPGHDEKERAVKAL